jgi:hypothetical protein
LNECFGMLLPCMVCLLCDCSLRRAAVGLSPCTMYLGGILYCLVITMLGLHRLYRIGAYQQCRPTGWHSSSR